MLDFHMRHPVVAPFWRAFVVLILAVGIVGFGGDAAAQTSMTPMTDEQGNVLFHVPDAGGLLAPGTFGASAIPAEGPGTRLVWHSGKAAFRAGRVGFSVSDGTEWNEDKVGAYSAAFGVDTKASGRGTVAFGQGTTATGDQAIAGGYRTTADGLRATSFGDLTKAPGNFSTALGIHTTAQATASLAIGRWNVVRGKATSWRNSDPLLAAGNGSGPSNRSNALLLRKNGDLTISGSLTQHSDRRLKRDVQSMGAVGEALDALRPVRFRYKEGSGHPAGQQLGLIAQDVQKEFPSLVREGADGLLSLAYPQLTAVLVKGLQQQRSRIDSLERRVDRLERLEEDQEKLVEQVAQLKSEETASSSLRFGLRSGLTGMVLLILGGLIGSGLSRRL